MRIAFLTKVLCDEPAPVNVADLLTSVTGISNEIFKSRSVHKSAQLKMIKEDLLTLIDSEINKVKAA